MINLYIFKSILDNAQLNKKKFVIFPYNKLYYNILIIFYKEKYIKNFMYIISNITNKKYILCELLYIGGYLKKFKIKIFNKNLKFIYKSFININNSDGLFIFNTSYGLVTLNQMKFLEKKGIILLHII